jgi:hypothetical protein
MADEKKDNVREDESPATMNADNQTPETEAMEESKEPAKTGNSLAEKRGRTVMAGVVLAVILSVIAVFVAAVFQLTARFIAHCPSDLKVNDPAPILWKKMETADLGKQPLGVAGKVLSEARFKGLAASKKQGKQE